jgi:RNA polymerase sigma factor for flagellar operon FliA
MTEIDPEVILRTANGVVSKIRLPRTVDVRDARQDAAVGFLEAMGRFDPARGLKPQTFGELRARGRVLDCLRQVDPSKRTLRKRVKAGLADPVIILSLDDQDMGEKPDLASVPPDVLAALAERDRRLAAAMRRLDDREWSAVALTLWCGLRLREIGQRLRMSESRVCKLRKWAVGKMREYLEGRIPEAHP